MNKKKQKKAKKNFNICTNKKKALKIDMYGRTN